MSAPRPAVRPLDPSRVWLGNLSHGIAKGRLGTALYQLGVYPDEITLFHQNNGVNSAAVLRFDAATDASDAVGRLNGINHEGLQGRGTPQPVKGTTCFLHLLRRRGHAWRRPLQSLRPHLKLLRSLGL